MFLAGDMSRLFFLQGPGGTGKTFIENHVLATVRVAGCVASAVASSGIASLLLNGWRTVHIRLKLPLDAKAICSLPIATESMLAQLLRRTSLIMWDEASMQSRRCEVQWIADFAISETTPYGEITTAYGGDWAHTLRLVPNSYPGNIVQACLQRSPPWRHMTTLRPSAPRATDSSRTSRAGADAYSRLFCLAVARGKKGLYMNPQGPIPIPPFVKAPALRLSQKGSLAWNTVYENLFSSRSLITAITAYDKDCFVQTVHLVSMFR